MLSYVDAIVLGIIEGITEFLPVSSTGHLILASSLLGISQTEFQKSFEIIIQLGAICAVVALYPRAFLTVEILKRLVVAFIPTGLIGLAFYSVIKKYLIGNELVVLLALALGGIALIVFEYLHREKENALEEIAAMPYHTSILIGLFQSIAVIPGVSRSAATILGGLILGLRRSTIVEFSFLLAVPTMLAATGIDLIANIDSFSIAESGVLAVGFATAFVVALISIKWLLSYIRTHSFTSFGIYRIIAALLFFIVFWL